MTKIDEWSSLAALLADVMEKYGPEVLKEIEETSENKEFFNDS